MLRRLAEDEGVAQAAAPAKDEEIDEADYANYKGDETTVTNQDAPEAEAEEEELYTR